MSTIATRAELEARLKRVAKRLLARQFARAAFSGLAGAGIGLGLGVLFLDLLPRFLFGATTGPLAISLAALGGFIAGAAYQFRLFTPPTMHDAALALEARLERDTGALGAALRTVEDSVFYQPLLAQAREDFALAGRSPAPVLIPTARLVIVPLIVLASVVAFAGVISAGMPQGGGGGDAPGSSAASAWAPVDIGGTRTAQDQAALRRALGMKEVAANLSKSAATLRDANATTEQKANALNEAKGALASDAAKSADVEAIEVPDELPTDDAGQEALADKIARVAAGMNGMAKRLENDAGGRQATDDSGRNGEFGENGATRELVPFPKLPEVETAPQRALAVQTPARREMAERAVRTLERIRNE